MDIKLATDVWIVDWNRILSAAHDFCEGQALIVQPLPSFPPLYRQWDNIWVCKVARKLIAVG
jgi:hypothetical protein